MANFQTLSSKPLETISVRVSWRLGPTNNWKHQEFNTLPSLKFNFDDADARFANKDEELRIYRNAYWETEFSSGIKNQTQYELDLHEAVLKAIVKVKNKWNKKLAEDLNRDFI
jgi:hypothetical protein